MNNSDKDSKVARVLHHRRPASSPNTRMASEGYTDRPCSSQMHSGHHMKEGRQQSKQGSLPEEIMKPRCRQNQSDHDYLHPAALNRWAYILPISPIPMMPMEAVSFVNPILQYAVLWKRHPTNHKLTSTEVLNRICAEPAASLSTKCCDNELKKLTGKRVF